MERLTRSRWISSAAFVFAMLAMLIGGLRSRPAGSSEMRILVPAYFYPSREGPWEELNESAAQVPITAILNPASGPGTDQDANYTAAVDALREAGGKVVGYVHTQYGLRPLAQVKTEVDRYADWYRIDGVFVDEMSASGAAAVLDYYGELFDYIKEREAEWEVIGNPGTNTHQSHLLRPTADRFVVTEDVGAVYESFVPSPWHADYDPSRFAHLVHSEPSATAMSQYVELARSRHAGLVYVTDDVLPNPWDRLPSYWDAEVDAVAGINRSMLAGDYDLSGRVDQGDLDLVLLHWGGDGSIPPEGWSGPPPRGSIDQAELDAVLLGWGNTSGAARRLRQVVPEPASLLIASAVVFFAITSARGPVQRPA